MGSVNIDNATNSEEENSFADSSHDTVSNQKDATNENFIIYAIGSESKNKIDWTVDMDTNRSHVRYKLDTGAQVNVMPKFEYNRLLKKPMLQRKKVTLTAYNGTSIPVVGRCIGRVAHKENRYVHCCRDKLATNSRFIYM